MNLQLHTIEAVCNSASGIKLIQITSVGNIVGAWNYEIIDENEVYTVYFRKNTAQYKEKSEDSDQNNKIVQEISFFLPQRRLSVDLLIEKIINKRIVVKYTDWDGNTGVLYKAKMAYSYDSGQKRTDQNGYNMKFYTEKVIGSLNYTGINISFPSPGDPWEGAVPGVALQDAWVLIEPEVIAQVPTATGNITYLNKFVVAPNGIKYFIDKTGRAMAFPLMPQYRQSWTGISTDEVTVTNGPLPSVNVASKMFLYLNGNQQMYLSTPPLDEGQATVDGQKIKFSRALESTDRIEAFWIPDFN